jgi:hypothetical protein
MSRRDAIHSLALEQRPERDDHAVFEVVSILKQIAPWSPAPSFLIDLHALHYLVAPFAL